MNNSQYSAEQIINMLIKRGWVATDAYNVNELLREISSIITNTSICNIQLSVDQNPSTANSGTTYTFTV
jgi:hypothetical protein